jgi:flagellar L-ring protein FlgH
MTRLAAGFLALATLWICVGENAWGRKSRPEAGCAEPADKKCSPLDRYLEGMEEAAQSWPRDGSPGSLFAGGGRWSDIARDFRAMALGDTVTVIVSDRATAIARGTTNTSRKSSVSAGVQSALGPLPAAGPLGSLAGASGDTKLQGQGETSRTMQLSTVVTSVVERVLPNGNLLIRGSKEIAVNSERQVVEVRGVVRPEDLLAGNQIASDRVAMLEVRVNGKGVVGDAIRRPFFLYRLLLGLLPI